MNVYGYCHRVSPAQMEAMGEAWWIARCSELFEARHGIPPQESRVLFEDEHWVTTEDGEEWLMPAEYLVLTEARGPVNPCSVCGGELTHGDHSALGHSYHGLPAVEGT